MVPPATTMPSCLCTMRKGMLPGSGSTPAQCRALPAAAEASTTRKSAAARRSCKTHEVPCSSTTKSAALSSKRSVAGTTSTYASPTYSPAWPPSTTPRAVPCPSPTANAPLLTSPPPERTRCW